MVSLFARSFLAACQEAVVRQQEVVPLLAKALGVDPREIFYRWMECELPQVGVFAAGEWRYFFHGNECNLYHLKDGRCLRVDFGPQGRLDTFTGWGVLQFIMTTKDPWREFPQLQAYLAKTAAPFTHLSGSHAKMVLLFEELENAELVEVADAELCALLKSHRIVNSSGATEVHLPPGLSKRTFFDLWVCERYVISQAGRQVIEVQKTFEP